MDGASPAPLPDGKAVAVTVVRGPDTGAKFELTSSRIVIGRKRGDVLLKDRETSSLHASIEYAPDGRFILKDLGSTNGTWLEGKRITVAEIQPGQHLKIGANHLLFSVADGLSEATRQGIGGSLGDASLPSPWTSAAPPMPVAPAPPSAGPLDVDLGMPDFAPFPSSGPFSEPTPAPVAAAPRPASAPPPPAAPAPSSFSAGSWPAPPPVSAAWPPPPPPPSEASPPPPPPPPVDPLSRTTPGISARTLPEKQRSEAPPPLPPLPTFPGSPTDRGGTAVSPVVPMPAPPPAHAAVTPVPSAKPPAASGLPEGVERSVYGVYLVVERGRDRGRVFAVNRQVTVLGRSGTEVLINDPDISRRHAALDVQGEGKYVLRDLNSTNGTLLNGVAVQSERISPNDKIRMGSTTIKLVVGDDRVAAELARLATEGA